MDIKNHVEGNWKQLKGALKIGLGKLTHDDWQIAEGGYDELLGAVQKKYAVAKNEAEEMISKCLDSNAMQTVKNVGTKCYGETEKFIKDHPMSAVIIAFIAGVWFGRK